MFFFVIMPPRSLKQKKKDQKKKKVNFLEDKEPNKHYGTKVLVRVKDILRHFQTTYTVN